MQLKYDLDVRALYVQLSDRPVATTAEVDGNAAVDLDESGSVVGIEIVSIDLPWALHDIVGKFHLAREDAAQLWAYFGPDAGGGVMVPELAAKPVQASLVAA